MLSVMEATWPCCRCRRSEDGEEGEQDGQHLADQLAVLHLAHAVLQVIHRAAAPFAFFVPAAEEDAQHVFGIVGHHAHDGGDPHPEHRAGAAHGDGVGHARDVARADGGGQGGAQGLELGNGMLILAPGDALVGEQAADGVFSTCGRSGGTGRTFVSSVISTPVPMSRTSAGTPHTTPLMASLTEERRLCVMLSMVHDPFSRR
jgi:hypothetical protein